MVPILISGCPNLAFSAARMMSQSMAISHPPPNAKPFTAAMIGILQLVMRSQAAGSREIAS